MSAGLLADLKFAWSSLRRRPLFLIPAVLTLALAIGGNLAIGTLVYSRYVAPLPYPDGGRLVVLKTSLDRLGIADAGVPEIDFQRWRTLPGIESAGRMMRASPALNDGRGATRVEAALVEPALLQMLGARPQLGGLLQEGDEDGVLLTHAVWQREYGADPGVVGRPLRIDGRPRVVRGVLPAGFDLLQRRVGYLLPLVVDPAERESRNWRGYVPVLRLAPGVELEQLRRQLDAMESAHRGEDGVYRQIFDMSGYAPALLPLREWLHGDLRPALRLLQAAVAAILLLACANVAQLLLLRAGERRAELGLRQALGAGRGRLARLLLGETLLLASLGTVAGLGLATLAESAIRTLGWIPSSPPVSPLFMLLAAIALALLCSLLCALPAMLGFWRDASAALRPGMRVTGGGMPRLRQGLVVAQTALTVVLLVGAGLLLRSFTQITSVDPGFHRAGVLMAVLDLDATRYPDASARNAMWTRALEAARALPGVSVASFGSTPPFGTSYQVGNYQIDGQPPDDGAAPFASTHSVEGDYFQALGIPLLAGRTLQPGDAAQRNVVVDERLVARHFAGRDGLGERVVIGDPEDPDSRYTIVGVVGSVRQNSLEESEASAHPAVYYHREATAPPSGILLLRSELPLSGLVAPLRDALRRIDAEQPVDAIEPLQQRIDASLEKRRAPLVLLGAFAVVALVLASIGQYGVVAWGVTQRESELGLRLAVGAQRRDLLWLVLRGGVGMTLVGLALGLCVAAAASRLMSAQLYGVTAVDPLTYLAVAALLALVAVGACLMPAWRATRLAPAVALRGE